MHQAWFGPISYCWCLNSPSNGHFVAYFRFISARSKHISTWPKAMDWFLPGSYPEITQQMAKMAIWRGIIGGGLLIRTTSSFVDEYEWMKTNEVSLNERILVYSSYILLTSFVVYTRRRPNWGLNKPEMSKNTKVNTHFEPKTWPLAMWRVNWGMS